MLHIAMLAYVNGTICLFAVPRFRSGLYVRKLLLRPGSKDESTYSMISAVVIFNATAVFILFYIFFYMVVQHSL